MDTVSNGDAVALLPSSDALSVLFDVALIFPLPMAPYGDAPYNSFRQRDSHVFSGTSSYSSLDADNNYSISRGADYSPQSAYIYLRAMDPHSRDTSDYTFIASEHSAVSSLRDSPSSTDERDVYFYLARHDFYTPLPLGVSSAIFLNATGT